VRTARWQGQPAGRVAVDLTELLGAAEDRPQRRHGGAERRGVEARASQPVNPALQVHEPQLGVTSMTANTTTAATVSRTAGMTRATGMAQGRCSVKVCHEAIPKSRIGYRRPVDMFGIGWRQLPAREERVITSMKGRVALVVTVMLIAGCGGGSDGSKGGGGSNSAAPSAESAGDQEYVDPMQNLPGGGGGSCLSKRQVQEKIDRIRARAQSPEREQQAIKAVRGHAC
jgi:hypothetical protein